jgi:hypothetical protein
VLVDVLADRLMDALRMNAIPRTVRAESLFMEAPTRLGAVCGA